MLEADTSAATAGARHEKGNLSAGAGASVGSHRSVPTVTPEWAILFQADWVRRLCSRRKQAAHLVQVPLTMLVTLSAPHRKYSKTNK